MSMSAHLTGNPIADGIATFVVWYVLAPYLAWCAGGIIAELLGLERLIKWAFERFGAERLGQALEALLTVVLVAAVLVLTVAPPWTWACFKK
jgi:uncharacterized membrane protein YqgA involved in biofilm formation